MKMCVLFMESRPLTLNLPTPPPQLFDDGKEAAPTYLPNYPQFSSSSSAIDPRGSC